MTAVITLTTSAGTISPSSITVPATGAQFTNWTVSGLSYNQSVTVYWTSSQSNRFGSGSITSSTNNTAAPTSPPATSPPATSPPATSPPCSPINLSNCSACGGTVFGGVCAI
jgi:predicted extracellular nuclease